jgi:hypothetical protein
MRFVSTVGTVAWALRYKAWLVVVIMILLRNFLVALQHLCLYYDFVR